MKTLTILQEGMYEYLLSLIDKNENQILLEMENYAKKKDFPIIGPLVGHILMQYARLIKAKRILELGSGFGYSAIWFAKASREAEIICTDLSEGNKDLATSYFKRLDLNNIKFILGNGLDVINQLEGEFDIIFCDIEKEDYPKAYEMTIPKIKKGGLLITDNTLWYGRVYDPKANDASTRGVQDYNKLAFSDSRVISSIIPIRDGLSISLKL